MSDNVSYNGTAEERVAEVVDAFMERVRRGEKPNVEEYARRHPEVADVLRQILPAMQFVRPDSFNNGSSLTAPAEDLPGELGDFRIIREVGRGGMGVVYEAEQVSLRRRVALKVLPFAATMDPRHLRRFQNEAQAAACLHHTNIVPVYSVGCERGVHFYAMQFIDGQPLSELIRQLAQGPVAREERTTPYKATPEDAAAANPTVRAAGDATPLTSEGKRGREYYRKVAELGVQAAEALDHAHQLGIVHRDIKPGNLLLDGRGNLWVTDFGLAQMQQGEGGLTMTGDLVGTLRYMSPEQALAKRVLLDHRTDIYSLGVTLYELLTLRPPFRGIDRQELLQQIAFEEPRRPRRLDRAIPMELEVIALKAMEKRPQDRYATARELADDLERWLRHEPIHARRPTLVQRALKWGRRHRPVVAACVTVLLMALWLAGYVAWTRNDQAVRRAAIEQVILAALKDSQDWQEQRRLPEALSAARRADGLLAGTDVDESLGQRVRARRADLELLDKLENVRLERETEVKGDNFDNQGADEPYGQMFRDAGMDVEALPAEVVAERIRASTVAIELAAVLDYWALVRRTIRGIDDPSWKDLLQVARLADPDAWRTRMREALQRRDRQALREMVASEGVFRLPPITLEILGMAFLSEEARGQGEAFLREAQRQYPNNFWLNNNLQNFYHALQHPRWEEAIRFAAVTVAFRPDSPGAHCNLGRALQEKGRLDESIAEYREAIRLKKDYAMAHNNLGNALHNKGQFDEAIAEFHEAIRLKTDFAWAHSNLGLTLRAKGLLDEAIAEFREALRIQKDFAEAHSNLGVAYIDKGMLDEAIAEYREALRIQNDSPKVHNNLGSALRTKGQLDQAIAEHREALRIDEDYFEAHLNLGEDLFRKRQLDGAMDEFREAIRLKKDCAEAYNNLGAALRDKGRPDEAIGEYRKAIRLKKDFAEAHDNLGTALSDKGLLVEAIAEHREAIRLKKDFANAHCNLGNALRNKGQLNQAVAQHRAALRINEDFAEAHLGLGNDFLAQGRLDEAIAEYRVALRLKKDNPEAHNNLGGALAKKEQLDDALGEFRTAIRLKQDFADAHCNLGIMLQLKGQFAEALVHLRLGHEIGLKKPRWPYPSAQWVRICEQLVELDGKLPAILNGQKQPVDTAERLALAQLCQLPCKKQYAAAVQFVRDAFADKPQLADDLNAQLRYNAACAAALAGCGQGKDADKLDAKERARLRQQALDWLRADLKTYRQTMEKSGGKAGPLIAQQMQHWLQDTDFAGVRGPESLARLPEAERPPWQKLWDDVAQMRAKAQGKAPAVKKSDTK